MTNNECSLASLSPLDTQDNPFWYSFKVQCTSCREIHGNWISINRFEQNELSGSRGAANFVWRCKNCKRESSANILQAPKAYTQSSPPESRNLIELDCRGLELLEFRPEGEWMASGLETSTAFSQIDLTEGDWFDYDEKAGTEVSIREAVWHIKRA